jgi:tetratricopeptide (TPR) repeat protein
MSHDKVVVLASCLGLALLGVACAPREPTSRARLSSAELSTGYAEAAAESATSGAYSHALDFAERAVAVEPSNPWAHYDRGVALHHLHMTDAAVAAYRDAEVRFGDGGQWGKSIAIYGRARALDDVGRCAEARAAYAQYAAFVRSFDPPAAEMAEAYAKECREAETSLGDTTTSNVTSMIIGRDYKGALAAAAEAERSKEPRSPWLDYDRAVALARLGRTDEALLAFRKVEQQLAETPTSNSWWGRSIAIYGRARALTDAGRCREAKRAYEDYAAFVRATNPQDADMALAIAKNCGVAP